MNSFLFSRIPDSIASSFVRPCSAAYLRTSCDTHVASDFAEASISAKATAGQGNTGRYFKPSDVVAAVRQADVPKLPRAAGAPQRVCPNHGRTERKACLSRAILPEAQHLLSSSLLGYQSRCSWSVSINSSGVHITGNANPAASTILRNRSRIAAFAMCLEFHVRSISIS